jgi:hypothetical protein
MESLRRSTRLLQVTNDTIFNDLLEIPLPRRSRCPLPNTTSDPSMASLKRTRIGNETTFYLEFHLAYPPEYLGLLAPFEAWPVLYKLRHGALRPPTKRTQWTLEEDVTLVEMKVEKNCSWEETSAALPPRSLGAI